MSNFDYRYLAGTVGAAIAQRKFVSSEYSQLQGLRGKAQVTDPDTSSEDVSSALDTLLSDVSKTMSAESPSVNVSSARMGFDLAMTEGSGIGDEWTAGAGMGVLADYAESEMRSNSPAFPKPIHRELNQMLERICLVSMPWNDPTVDEFVENAIIAETADFGGE